MKVISVGSGSSGNSFIVKSDTACIIVDAGISAKRTIKALRENEICTEDVLAIMITHEHIDHVKSIKTLANKLENATVYASEGTICASSEIGKLDERRVEAISAGDCIVIENTMIKTFNLSHDAAEPIGYSISEKGIKVSIITDTGTITDEIYNEISSSDMIVLEANHDENILMYGDYPYGLKMRILGDLGHLSNYTAANTLCDYLREYYSKINMSYDKKQSGIKLPLIMFAHLSEKNNAPLYVRKTIDTMLKERGFLRGVHYNMEIAVKDEVRIINR